MNARTEQPENDSADRYALYEAAAQSPTMQAQFIRAVHSGREGETVTLGEDFSGAGALSRAWLEIDPANRAVCVDCDSEPIERLRAIANDDPRLTIHCKDVREVADLVGVIAVLNFSICELQTRSDLLSYLTHARSRLIKQAGQAGLITLDIYGGVDAYARGESEVELRNGALYIWEQRQADPLTGRVINAMHFVLPDRTKIRDAFVYHWRLWSVPELTDALAETGFGEIKIYDRLGDAIDGDGRLYPSPIESADDLDENYVVYLTAQASR